MRVSEHTGKVADERVANFAADGRVTVYLCMKNALSSTTQRSSNDTAATARVARLAGQCNKFGAVRSARSDGSLGCRSPGYKAKACASRLALDGDCSKAARERELQIRF